MAIKATGNLFVNGAPVHHDTTADLSAPVGIDSNRGVFEREFDSATDVLIEFEGGVLVMSRPKNKPKPTKKRRLAAWERTKRERRRHNK